MVRDAVRPRIAVLLLAVIASPAHAGTSGAPIVPGRLIVKYRPAVDACVHCLLSHGASFGRPSLDDLNRTLGVRGARALFFDHHTMHGGRAAAWASRVAAVRAANPLRATRARGV